MLWVVLVTMVVTILRFTITPTTAVVCFRWVLFCGRIVRTLFHSFANSACYCIRGTPFGWLNGDYVYALLLWGLLLVNTSRYSVQVRRSQICPHRLLN
jgi:hypothetical protein